MSSAFDCEIQARLRDVNLGGHVDNVEVLRIIDEARILFFRYAPLPGLESAPKPGLLGVVPDGVAELVGSQRIDYREELRFAAFQPFQVRLWVSHIGRTSFAVGAELRVAADHAPAALAETSSVMWDHRTQAPWAITDELRATLTDYLGDPVSLRERPGA